MRRVPLGRRRLLIAGTALFAVSSLACGLADSQGLLVGGRLAQGFGAAMMSPAALSILTTTFQGSDRHKALGVWAGISAMASAAGLLFGGVLTEDFGWRWVFFVNLPMSARRVAAAYRERGSHPAAPQTRALLPGGDGEVPTPAHRRHDWQPVPPHPARSHQGDPHRG
jgi:MFS family permease